MRILALLPVCLPRIEGRVELLVTAADEFGETVEGDLTLQFGENQAPILDDPFELVLLEESADFGWEVICAVRP